MALWTAVSAQDSLKQIPFASVEGPKAGKALLTP